MGSRKRPVGKEPPSGGRLEDLQWLKPVALLNEAGSNSCRGKRDEASRTSEQGFFHDAVASRSLSPCDRWWRGYFYSAQLQNHERTGRRGAGRQCVTTAGKRHLCLCHIRFWSLQSRLMEAPSWICSRSQGPSSFSFLYLGEALLFIVQDGSQSPRPPLAIWL